MYSAIRFAILRPGATLPKRATPGSGAFDLYAPEDGTILSKSKTTIPVGIAHDLPCVSPLAGFTLEGIMIPRSGLATRQGIRLFYQGLIDHDYRGEIHVELENTTNRTFHWKQGDRLCQIGYVLMFTGEGLEITPEQLTTTSRGSGGFGSTGR